MKDGFVFHKDWMEALSGLPDNVRLELYDAIVCYACKGEHANLSPHAKTAFSFIKSRIDADKKRTGEISMKRSEAGRKGMSKRWEEKPKEEESTPKPQQQQAELFPPEETTPPPLTKEQEVRVEKARKYKYGEFVTLTREEYTKLCEAHTEKGAKRMIEILDNYKGQNGKRYKSDYRAILNWVTERYNEEIMKYGQGISTEEAVGKAADTARSTPNHQGVSGRRGTSEQGASPEGGSKAQKDYTERF